MLRSLTLTRRGALLAAALALLAGAGPAVAADKPAAADVDVVICLDVSGSMNGLLDSARIKLWDIVNDLAKIKPTPNLRVGLYSYGGSTARGYAPAAGWVKKLYVPSGPGAVAAHASTSSTCSRQPSPIDPRTTSALSGSGSKATTDTCGQRSRSHALNMPMFAPRSTARSGLSAGGSAARTWPGIS